MQPPPTTLATLGRPGVSRPSSPTPATTTAKLARPLGPLFSSRLDPAIPRLASRDRLPGILIAPRNYNYDLLSLGPNSMTTFFHSLKHTSPSAPCPPVQVNNTYYLLILSFVDTIYTGCSYPHPNFGKGEVTENVGKQPPKKVTSRNRWIGDSTDPRLAPDLSRHHTERVFQPRVKYFVAWTE